MLILSTTIEFRTLVSKIVDSIDRLSELVTIEVFSKGKDSSPWDLKIANALIYYGLNWNDSEPPYIFPKFKFNKNNLLASLFYKLKNHAKCFEYLDIKSEIHKHFTVATALHFGKKIEPDQLEFLSNSEPHNLAVCYHLGALDRRVSASDIIDLFQKSILEQSNRDFKNFTRKHLAHFLIDMGFNSDAKQQIHIALKNQINQKQEISFKQLLSQVLMTEIQIPYKENCLKKITKLHEECIAYYEKNNLIVKAGLVLIDASKIQSYRKDYMRSKELINRAIQYFSQEDIPQFMGEAMLQKGTLLHAWSKDGHPNYYKASIHSYQNALTIFKKDIDPHNYADIQHSMALIYSEIPVAEKEKSLWAALSASAFKEALEYFTMDFFPYQYGIIAHNYATALMHFPSKSSKTHRKALYYFEEALKVKTADKYPFERALSLLNRIELLWILHRENKEDDIDHLRLMKLNAEEVKILVNDQKLIDQAERHLSALKQLHSTIQ